MRMRTGRCLALLAFLCIATPAQAVPIGTFSWDGDDFFFGPVFTVENFSDSGGTFFDVWVHLTFDDGTSNMELSLGDIAAGGSVQSFEDLSPYTFSILEANLRFSFELAGTTTVGSLSAFGESQMIDFQASTASVPEPSTLLLLGGGFAAAALIRRRRPSEPDAR